MRDVHSLMFKLWRQNFTRFGNILAPQYNDDKGYYVWLKGKKIEKSSREISIFDTFWRQNQWKFGAMTKQ